MKCWGVFLLMFFLFLPWQAQAARFSGGYLLYVCASDLEGRELVAGGHAVCQSYISGVIDYHNLIHSLGTSPSVDFCVPENIDLFALQNLVVRYFMRNRAEHEHFIAAPGVALALFEAFPCK